MKHSFRSLFLLVLFCISTYLPAYAQTYTVYAALYKENNLAIINPDQGKIVQRIQVGRGPDQIVMNAEQTKLFVANTGEYSISIVDLGTKTETQVLRLPVNRRGVYAGIIAAAPDASMLYVAERPDKPEPLRVYVIDMNKEAQVAQFNVGTNVNSMSVSNDGKKLFVVDKIAKSITVYDTETYGVAGTIPLLKGFEANVECIACCPTEAKAIITYGNTNKLQIVSTESYKTVSSHDMPKYKTGMQRDIYIDPAGKYAFIINDKDNLKDVDGVIVYEIAKDEIVKLFNAGSVPRGMATANGNRFFVASNYLKWYNMLTLEHLKSMSLRTEIRGILALEK